MKKQTLADKKIIELTEIIALKDSISKTDESIIQSLKEQVQISKDIAECDNRMDLYNKSVIANLRSQIDYLESNANGFSKGVIAGAIVASIIYFIIYIMLPI